MEFKDYYAALGLDPGASGKEIKSAFRKLARAHHPDVNKESGSEARFKEISAAYETLKDAAKRAEYDQLYAYWKNGGRFDQSGGAGFPGGAPFGGARAGAPGAEGVGGVDLDEIFQRLFGQGQNEEGAFGGGWFGGFSNGFDPMGSTGPRGAGFHEAPRPRRIQTIELTLEEAFQGTSRQVSLAPSGVGAGTGAGPGRAGRIRIPAGVIDGQTIRIPIKPAGGPGAGSGEELFLMVRILPHRHFRVEGRNLLLDLPAAPWEAALGATVTIPTPGGAVKLKIPAGSQTGKRLSLKGRGLPGKPPGDLLVRLQVMAPPAQTEAQRRLYERMKEEMPFDPRRSLAA